MPMKANKTEPQSQTRKQKKDTPWILHIFNHICFVTTIIGCYSCHWKIKQEKKFKHGQCCSLRERLFYPCLVISFCMSVLLVFVWVESSNEYNGFDWVIFIGTGLWFFWSIVLLSFLGILAAYTSLLLVLGFLLLWEGIELYLHWCHKILILLVIVICSFFFWILFTYWKDRWLTVGLSLQVFAPYIHLSSIAMMVILSWPLAFYLIHLEGEARIRRYQMTCNERKRNKRCNVLTKLRALQVAIGLPFFLILLCLYLLPLGNFSACVQEKNKLAPKPYFFGHRGAPMLGPENTIMSFEKAVEHGAYGLESDVHISYDHVPFLMHDSDLRRTTNIKEVLPNASLTHPSLFDWDFLSTLNAGKWFSHAPIKPFFGMKPLSEADRERAGNQKIPKLTELLELAQKEKKFVIFDLYGPAPNHSLRALYVHHVVSTILDSQIEQRLIFWLPGFEREYVKKKAPGFQQVSRLHSVERLTKENITRINVDYKNLFYNGMRHQSTICLCGFSWIFFLQFSLLPYFIFIGGKRAKKKNYSRAPAFTQTFRKQPLTWKKGHWKPLDSCHLPASLDQKNPQLPKLLLYHSSPRGGSCHTIRILLRETCYQGLPRTSDHQCSPRGMSNHLCLPRRKSSHQCPPRGTSNHQRHSRGRSNHQCTPRG
ncbi:glycerophosphodiester phosphodiesterase domain-containing protein 4-like isoform X7 [Bos indicus]|uniref:Glycerophosphodiester phosphodiesterase domain-containing protein 4-like isoform X7 n=1 Tax=Bos indicus TaxID=9915 RepID=A0ABM4RV43_BOSIN